MYSSICKHLAIIYGSGRVVASWPPVGYPTRKGVWESMSMGIGEDASTFQYGCGAVRNIRIIIKTSASPTPEEKRFSHVFSHLVAVVLRQMSYTRLV